MQQLKITRRSFGAAAAAATLAPQLSAQSINKTLLNGHIHDLLESMNALEKATLAPVHLFSTARSHELLAAHFEEIGINDSLQKLVRAYPDRIIYPDLESAIPAMQAVWKRYGLYLSKEQILRPVNFSLASERAQLAAFIAKEGFLKLSGWYAGRLRATAQGMRAGLRGGVRIIPAQDTSSYITLNYPFLAGGDGPAYTLFGAGLTVVGALWAGAPLLIPESFVCPVCGIAGAVFTIGGAWAGYYGLTHP